ncbi:MAG: oligosaccharide flippase family protein [Pseudomonadota bacterium]
MAIIETLRDRASRLFGHEASLYGKVTRGASWVMAGHGAELAMRLASSLILTRLLSPAAFGIMATAQVFIYTAIMVSDVGIRALVITHEDSDDAGFLRTVWSFQIVRGVVLTALVVTLGQLLGVAQELGWFSADNSFAEPILPSLLAVLGVTLAIDGLRSTNEHVLERDLRQDFLVKLDTSVKILGIFATVLAVWITRSVWGFVYATVITAFLRTLLSLQVVPGPRMRWHWDKAYIGYIIKRGKWIGVSSWTTLATNLADKVLIGAFFGNQVLGVYTLAHTLADAFHALMTRIANSIAMPAIRQMLTRAQEQFESVFLRLRTPIHAVSAAVGLSLIALADTIVSGLYDERYQLAGPMLAILALKYLIFHLSLNCFVLEARREFGRLATFNMIRMVALWTFAFGLAYAGRLEGLILLIAVNHIVERSLASYRLVSVGLIKLRTEAWSYAVTVVTLMVAMALLLNSPSI